jgi:signal transduction histidine kinase
VAAWCDRRRSLSAVGVSFVGILIAVAVAPHFSEFTARLLLGPVAFVTVTWLIGDNVRVRRAYVAELEARAEQLEREQATEAQRARDGERTRIARELHDVVAHHVSVIAVQAGAARMVAEQEEQGHASSSSPSMSDDMLASIESTARQALAELRRLLGVLRKGDDDLDRAPQPGLHQVNALVTQMCEAGTTVDLEIDDSVPAALPPGVDLSAYRIIQEALTNVLKHANGAATRVVVRVDHGDLELTVHDSGPGPVWPQTADRAAAVSGGHGLMGMGERVALFGGQLSHGPNRSGGFDVVARIPLGTDPGGEQVDDSDIEDPDTDTDTGGLDQLHQVQRPATRFDL